VAEDVDEGDGAAAAAAAVGDGFAVSDVAGVTAAGDVIASFFAAAGGIRGFSGAGDVAPSSTTLDSNSVAGFSVGGSNDFPDLLFSVFLASDKFLFWFTVGISEFLSSKLYLFLSWSTNA
jgi:hypothetical protein